MYESFIVALYNDVPKNVALQNTDIVSNTILKNICPLQNSNL